MNILKEIGMIAGFASISLTIKEYTAEFFNGVGKSMEPTIPEMSVIFIDKLTPRIKGVDKGDVVIMRSIMSHNEYICKRIIHTAGDTFELNGRHITVPPHSIWVEGDNQDNSFDSRHYGPLSLHLLEGVARFMIYPDIVKVK